MRMCFLSLSDWWQQLAWQESLHEVSSPKQLHHPQLSSNTFKYLFIYKYFCNYLFKDTFCKYLFSNTFSEKIFVVSSSSSSLALLTHQYVDRDPDYDYTMTMTDTYTSEQTHTNIRFAFNQNLNHIEDKCLIFNRWPMSSWSSR